MKIHIIALCLCLSSAVIFAENNKQSVMFQDQQAQQNQLTSMPPPQDLGDHCQQLAKEIDAMKGKPQRRYALSERYKNECELKR